MAGVDLGGPREKKGAKQGLKRPKKRISIRIDMTPMVDIAFLLLIFYMVTTVFSQPLRMEISLPPKPEMGQEDPPIPVGKSFLLMMFVDKDDSLYYQIGEDMNQPKMVNFPELSEIIRDKNVEHASKLVMVLKLDQTASYESMVKIIDEIQTVERGINAGLKQQRLTDPSVSPDDYSVKFSLQNMNAWDEHVLTIVKEGGVVEE